MIHTHRLELFACRASENFARQVINYLNQLKSPDEPDLHLGAMEVTPFSDGEFQPQYSERPSISSSRPSRRQTT